LIKVDVNSISLIVRIIYYSKQYLSSLRIAVAACQAVQASMVRTLRSVLSDIFPISPVGGPIFNPESMDRAVMPEAP